MDRWVRGCLYCLYAAVLSCVIWYGMAWSGLVWYLAPSSFLHSEPSRSNRSHSSRVSLAHFGSTSAHFPCACTLFGHCACISYRGEIIISVG
eukprot:COSAG06_NODE_5369_length_3520_cov_104.475007_2_plen_92_part_00